MNNIHLEHCPLCSSSKLQPTLRCKDYLTSDETFTLVSCSVCGFAFTQDFPSEDSIGRYYDAPEYISHTDTKEGIINKLYHYARSFSLKSKVNLVNQYTHTINKSLLDIGCGTGYFLEAIASKNWDIEGIEKSETVRKQVKERIDLQVNDSDYLPKIESESKDAITMWHVLEHVENLNETMDQLHRILKKGGTAFIALPNKKSLDALYYKEYWAAYDVPRHLWHFSPPDFNELAKRHKFEVIKQKAMYFDPFYISMLSEKYKKTKMGTIVGLTKGAYFCFRSFFDTKKCSSVIYILKKTR